MVEHLKELGTRLMDGADDRSTSLGQSFEERYTLVARGTVQPTAWQAGRQVEGGRHRQTQSLEEGYTLVARGAVQPTV